MPHIVTANRDQASVFASIGRGPNQVL